MSPLKQLSNVKANAFKNEHPAHNL